MFCDLSEELSKGEEVRNYAEEGIDVQISTFIRRLT
jgi:hypothetical protein